MHRTVLGEKKKKTKYTLLAGWEACTVKDCDRGLEHATQGCRQKYLPWLSQQITSLLFSSLSQITFLILSVPPLQTLRALQMQSTLPTL